MYLHWKTVKAPSVVDHRSEFRLALTHQTQPKQTPTRWWSALLTLQDVSIDTLLSSVGALIDNDVSQVLHIPSDYTVTDRSARLERHYVSVFATHDVLRLLNEKGLSWGVSGLHLGHQIDTATLTLDMAPDPDIIDDVEAAENSVIMAVVDDGIAFAHEVFCHDRTSSRIALVSLLEAHPQNKKRPVSVGHALGKRQIDKLLHACTQSGMLDEARFYREAGLLDFSRANFTPASQQISHGTHVLALAAGYPMGMVGNARPILCAVLPSSVTEDTTGYSLAPSLNLALKRLVRQASRFRVKGQAAKPPVVFNFSYGTLGGPHDGADMIAQIVESYFGEGQSPLDQEMRLVLPVGNGNLAQVHAQVSKRDADCEETELDLQVLPDDRTASFVQMWMPYSDQRPLPRFADVQVTTPWGRTSDWVTIGREKAQELVTRSGERVARLSWFLAPAPTGRVVVELTLNPTAALAQTHLAPSGRWCIRIKPHALSSSESVACYIERDTTLRGYKPGGRQPYFNNSCYQKFDGEGAPLSVDPPESACPVRRAGTLSDYVCGQSPLVVAALTRKTGLVSDYSATGPGQAPQGHKSLIRSGPDAAAAADDSSVLRGVLSAGASRGSFTRQSGTSMASPRVARLLADALASGKAGDREWLWRTAAEMDAHYPKPKPRESRVGGGRMVVPVQLQRWPEKESK